MCNYIVQCRVPIVRATDLIIVNEQVLSSELAQVVYCNRLVTSYTVQTELLHLAVITVNLSLCPPPVVLVFVC